MPRRRKALGQKSSEEIEKHRKDKRERNKHAAAKLRQKLLDRTTELAKEAESEERKKADLMAEINELLSAREALESLLSVHKKVCQSLDFSRLERDPRSSPYSEISNSPFSGTSNSPSNSPKVFCSDTRNEISNMSDECSSNKVCSSPSNFSSISDCNEFSNTATSDVSSDRVIKKPRKSPSNNSFHGISKNFKTIVYSGPSNIPSNGDCRRSSNSPNSVVYSDSSRSSDISNSPSSVVFCGSNRSPSYDLSNSASASNSANNSPRNDVVYDENSNSSAMPSRPIKPVFLVVGPNSPCYDLSNSASNSARNSLNNDMVLNRKLDSSTMTTGPTRATFLEIPSASSSNSSNSSNGPRNDVVLDEKLDSSAMSSRLRRPTFSEIASASPSNGSNSSNGPRNNVVLDEKLDSSAMSSRLSRSTFVAIGGASSSNDSNSNCQKRMEDRPKSLNLGSKKTFELKKVETCVFVKPAPKIKQDPESPTYGFKFINFESMMEGGTGLTPVDNPMKSFCSFK